LKGIGDMARFKDGHREKARADCMYWCQLIKFWSKHKNPSGKPLSDASINQLLSPKDGEPEVDDKNQINNFYRWRTGMRVLDSSNLHMMLKTAQKQGLLPGDLKKYSDPSRSYPSLKLTASERLRSLNESAERVKRLQMFPAHLEKATNAIRDLREQIEDLKPRLHAYYKSIKVLQDLDARFLIIDDEEKCFPSISPNFLQLPEICVVDVFDWWVFLDTKPPIQKRRNQSAKTGAKVVHSDINAHSTEV
jgi:hypothetical protein